MIYLFSIKKEKNITSHKFFCDGIVYMHNTSSDIYYCDSDYKDLDNANKRCRKFKYELPENLNIIDFDDISYIKDIDKYIEINILNSI